MINIITIDGSVLPLFLGSIIYNKRREMDLTQIELANDICTQNTISKIEKHNIAPTVNILIKICLKLGLTLNDVFSDFSDKASIKEESILDAIERDVLLEKIESVDERLSLVEGKLNDNDMEQYELIKGIVDYHNKDYDTSLFILDKVLQYTKSSNDDIYTLLSYLFKGLNYMGQEHVDRAQYYFQMIENTMNESSKVSNASDLEILFICKTLASSFNYMNFFDKAYDSSQYGLKYATKGNVSYFLDELNYEAAISVKNRPDEKSNYEDYYNLAFYLAKANKNEKLLKLMNAK